MTDLEPAKDVSIEEYSNSSDFAMELDGDCVSLPRLKLLQAVSDVVKEKHSNFSQGMFIDESTGMILADDENDTFEFLPVFAKSGFSVFFKTHKDDLEYSHYEEKTAANAGLPPEGKDADGRDIVRQQTITLYGFVGGGALPFQYALRSSGLTFGRTVMTEMVLKNKFRKLPPFGRIFNVGAKEKAGPLGTYFVPVIKGERDCTKEELAKAAPWFKMLKEAKAKA